MRIPMRGAVGSLNAAVAGSILLFEAVAQRDPEGRPKPATTPSPPSPRRRASKPSTADATADTAEQSANEPVPDTVSVEDGALAAGTTPEDADLLPEAPEVVDPPRRKRSSPKS
jgi:hypothetical protein